MNELARTILAMKADGASIVYGEATAVNTVALEGAATPVELPALDTVNAGDYCAVLQQGADRLILGAIGGFGALLGSDGETKHAVRLHVFSSSFGTTDANGLVSISSSTFGLSSITGMILMPNYAVVAGSPIVQGIRYSSGNATLRFVNSTDGTAYASTAVGAASVAIVWGDL